MKQFDFQTEYNGVSFQYSNTARIKEREIHNYHEILYFLDGQADCLTAEGIHPLRPGSLLLIPKETYHFLRLSQCQSFTRLKLGFPESYLTGTPIQSLMNQFLKLESPTEEVLRLLQRLCALMTSPLCVENRYHAYTVFLHLLSELNTVSTPSAGGATVVSPLQDVMDYINCNLSEPLTTGHLAQALNLSASTITHRFKQVYGISVHRYVQQKRLFLAQTLVRQGNRPSKIFTACGYKDYSSFYRAYLNYFGHPPSVETCHDSV